MVLIPNTYKILEDGSKLCLFSGEPYDISDFKAALAMETFAREGHINDTSIHVTATKQADWDSRAAGSHTHTSAQVGLGNVTNESKATMFTSPAFTGTPTAPTAAAGTNTTQIATTAFVTAAINAKSSIIIQTTAPTGNASTLWINSSSGAGTLNYWSGSAWVPIKGVAG